MMQKKHLIKTDSCFGEKFAFSLFTRLFLLFLLVSFSFPLALCAQDLRAIQKAGVLRHLGVPYANFVTGSGDGLSVELMKGFASYLGVRYVFVASSWSHIFGDLTGRHAQRSEHGVELLGEATVVGDVVACGITVLPWRQDIISFSQPTFPSSVWLVARAESDLKPIQPTGSIESDIAAVKTIIAGHTVLALKNTCLDPDLYNLSQTRADIRLPEEGVQLNELAPSVLNGEADATLLDVPDALIALEKWPGQLKVIGPISGKQVMGVGFRKDAPELLEAFNMYLQKTSRNGSYQELVKKYYPGVFQYYSTFFQGVAD